MVMILKVAFNYFIDKKLNINRFDVNRVSFNKNHYLYTNYF